jgi:hypothetical protein
MAVLTDREPNRCGNCGQQFTFGTFHWGGYSRCACPGAARTGGHYRLFCRACGWSALVGHEPGWPDPDFGPMPDRIA